MKNMVARNFGYWFTSAYHKNFIIDPKGNGWWEHGKGDKSLVPESDPTRLLSLFYPPKDRKLKILGQGNLLVFLNSVSIYKISFVFNPSRLSRRNTGRLFLPRDRVPIPPLRTPFFTLVSRWTDETFSGTRLGCLCPCQLSSPPFFSPSSPPVRPSTLK